MLVCTAPRGPAPPFSALKVLLALCTCGKPISARLKEVYISCLHFFHPNSVSPIRCRSWRCYLCLSRVLLRSPSDTPYVRASGSYCEAGSSWPDPCPIGTYGGGPSLPSADACSPCSPGRFCDDVGLLAPTGLCDPGYYCTNGSYTSAPSFPGPPYVTDVVRSTPVRTRAKHMYSFALHAIPVLLHVEHGRFSF